MPLEKRVDHSLISKGWESTFWVTVNWIDFPHWQVIKDTLRFDIRIAVTFFILPSRRLTYLNGCAEWRNSRKLILTECKLPFISGRKTFQCYHRNSNTSPSKEFVYAWTLFALPEQESFVKLLWALAQFSFVAVVVDSPLLGPYRFILLIWG